MNPEWKFKQLLPSDMHADPTHDEFFKTEDIGGLSNALVRETIQNSLDAKDPDDSGPLLVRFSFDTLTPSGQVNAFFSGLKPHLSASQNGIITGIDLAGPMRILTIEDYRTQGLEGDPLEAFASVKDPGKHNFYFFWRNVGRSEKKEGDRGRWGLGKAVFPVVSSIRTFFGYTIRKSDKRRLMMGHSLLRIHELGAGTWYQPYGHFGHFIDDEDPHFVHPIEDLSMIDEFSRLFFVSRGTESGLSISIPHVLEGISAKSITKAMLYEFFYPVLSGELELWIEEGDDTYEISKKSIGDVAKRMVVEDERFDLENYYRLLDFTRWVIEEKGSNGSVRLKSQDWDYSPRWNVDLFNPEELVDLKRRFKENERVAIQVPTKVERMGKKPIETSFDVYLEKDRELDGREDFFIREDLRVSGVHSLNQNNVRGMVVVSENPLVEMLGDAENPAHTEWQKDSRGFKEKYKHAPSCLSFVIQSVKQLAYYLTEVEEETDEDLLLDFFSLPAEESEATERRRGTKGAKGEGTEDDVPHPPVLPKPIEITQIQGGLLVRGTDHLDGIRFINIRVAYDVLRGNPFNRYSPEDFDLRYPPIKVSSTGIDKETRLENELRFYILDPKFEVKIEGFDLNRDIIVDADWSEVE